MKRIAIVLSMLLACVSLSAANTITVVSGSGQMSGTLESLNPFPSYSFLVFGQYYDGAIRFNAVSFVSSLAPNGMLTVIYKANAKLAFLLCNDQTCGNTSALLLWPSQKLWLVTAQFVPNANAPGTYDFSQASFEGPIVPEPSSILPVGSGILVLIGKVLKTRKE